MADRPHTHADATRRHRRDDEMRRRLQAHQDGDAGLDDPADLIPPWPCQQLHGGRPPYSNQGIDPDTGLCHHEECNPANDERVPNDQTPPSKALWEIMLTMEDEIKACRQSGTQEDDR